MRRQNIDIRKSLSLITLAVVGLASTGTPCQASDLQIHGFADLVGSKSDTDYALDDLGNHGRHLTLDPESRLGLNLSTALSDRISFASQIIGQGNDGGTYSLSVDWIFLTYRPVEDIAIRVGRQINPTFLYSEQLDVGFTYLWTRLPYEVYGLYPTDAFYGASVTYTRLAGDLQLAAQLYGGAGDVSVNSPNFPLSGSINDDKGINVSISSDEFRMRIGYTSNNPDLTFTPGISGSPVTTSTPADIGTLQILTAGGKFDLANFQGAAEIARLLTSGDFNHTATGAYASLGYHVLPNLVPYFVYSWQGNLNGIINTFPDPAVSDTRKTDQHAFTVGLNFRMYSSVVIKGEYMRSQFNFVDDSLNFDANTVTASVDMVF